MDGIILAGVTPQVFFFEELMGKWTTTEDMPGGRG